MSSDTANTQGEDMSSDTANKQVEDTPSDTANKQGEDTPSDTANTQGEDTPSDTAIKRGDDTPSGPDNKQMKDTPSDTAKTQGEDTPSGPDNEQMKDTPSSPDDKQMKDTPSDLANKQDLNDQSDPRDDRSSDQFAHATDYQHEVCSAENQALAIREHGDGNRNSMMGVNLQQVIQTMRSDVKMDITVNETTVVGNKNTIVQGNNEELSDMRGAIELSGDKMTNEHAEQTTRIGQEIKDSEVRVTGVIRDEGAELTATVTDTGHFVSNRMKEVTENKHAGMEVHLAKLKQQNAEFYRETEESTKYTTAKSVETQNKLKQTIENSSEKSSQEASELKCELQNVQQRLHETIKKETMHLQKEVTSVSQTLNQQMGIKDDLLKMTKYMDYIADETHTSKKETTEAVGCLQISVDSLKNNQENLKEETKTFQRILLTKLAKLQESIDNSNRQVQQLRDKVGKMDKSMKKLALESTVTDAKSEIINSVWRSARKSKRDILDACL